MLRTLLKIGEWQSQGKSEWDRFLEFPKISKKDKYGNVQNNYTLPVIFDLDNKEVIIESKNLKDFEDKDVKQALGIKMKGSNSKAICGAGISKRLGRIFQSFFGKEGEDSKCGELREAIEKTDKNLLTGDFGKLLNQIFGLKQSFLEQTLYETPSKTEVDVRKINEHFELNRNESIVFINIQIKSDNLGYSTPTLFSEIPEYHKFLKLAYFGKEKKQTKSKEKLCYASGELSDDVEELNLSNRYSLNKMFVTETKNYASVFDKKKFQLNYQVSAENQNKLDYASDFLLRQGFKVTIANVDHVIVPQFLQASEVDLEMALEGIHNKSDILFNLTNLEESSKVIEGEIEEGEIFWMNFIAFESDGKFFKSTELIKDVSNFHFNKMVQFFTEIYWEFREANFTDWDAVMTEYNYKKEARVPHFLNLNSLYSVIPLRKDKEKTNKALGLFKTILENRKVNQDLLFEYFVELILCHYYGRYKSYDNVKDYSQKGKKKRKDYFFWATRDAVFKYLAFFQFLKKLKLIDMEESIKSSESSNQSEKKEKDFFEKMELNEPQRAMFYLGRMLNKVEYIQTKDDKKKTVIEKVNFNGLEINNIQRLRNDLNEKAKQYRLKYPKETNSVIFIDNKFAEYFNYNNWNDNPLNPEEALFFLLTGYSFGASKNESESSQNKND